MADPLFVTEMDDNEQLRLLVRLPGDEDYFEWGYITESQRVQLRECGVFNLTDDTFGGDS